MPLDPADLKRRFDHHPPTNDSVDHAHRLIRANVRNLASGLNDMLPDCREKSLALTKLEEAMFWSNAAVARELNKK